MEPACATWGARAREWTERMDDEDIPPRNGDTSPISGTPRAKPSITMPSKRGTVTISAKSGHGPNPDPVSDAPKSAPHATRPCKG